MDPSAGGGSVLGAAGRGVWALAGAGVALVIGGAVFVLWSPSSPVAPSEPRSLATVAEVAPSPMTAEAAPTPPSAAVVEAPAAPPADQIGSKPAVATPERPARSRAMAPGANTRASASKRGAGGDGVPETALLEQARAALHSRPAEALELTRRHQARFPSGVLAQEREVIAIEALERLGQREAASVRAAAFERRYRGSVHQPRLERGGDTLAPGGGASNTAPP
jgi:hypothetical protein